MLRSMNALTFALMFALCFCGIVDAGCPEGDVRADCEVNWQDVADLASRWLDSGCSAPGCRAELDGAAGVDMGDFAVLARNWGAKGSYLSLIHISEPTRPY